MDDKKATFALYYFSIKYVKKVMGGESNICFLYISTIDAKEVIGAKFVKKVKSCDMIKANFPLKANPLDN